MLPVDTYPRVTYYPWDFLRWGIYDDGAAMQATIELGTLLKIRSEYIKSRELASEKEPEIRKKLAYQALRERVNDFKNFPISEKALIYKRCYLTQLKHACDVLNNYKHLYPELTDNLT